MKCMHGLITEELLNHKHLAAWLKISFGYQPWFEHLIIPWFVLTLCLVRKINISSDMVNMENNFHTKILAA